MDHAPTRAAVTPALRSRGSARGVVLVLVMLGLMLLASLIFYVLNLGQQTNRRIITQHAADNTVISGSTWLARQFNTVAMNNVGMVQLVVAANVLDAMPLAVDLTLRDQQAVGDVVQEQLARGVTDSWVRDALINGNIALPMDKTATSQIDRDLGWLVPLDNFLNKSAFDMKTMTFYDGPAGRGHLWRAMNAMDQYNQAAMENLGVLAQLNAIRGGEVNLPGDASAFMVRVAPDVPFKRGTFDDFERPVRNGLLPEQTDDTTTNRGPWDTLFGFRYRIGGGKTGYYIPGTTEVASGGRGNTPISGGAGGSHGGTFVQTGEEPARAYGVYGHQRWVLDRVGSFSGTQLYLSRFSSWVNTIANAKLGYLWPGPASPAKQVILSEWIIDFDEATAIADGTDPNDDRTIQETCFIAVEIKSRYPRGAAGFLSPGSFAYVYNRAHSGVRVVRRRGWVDPRTWSATKIDDHIWRDEWSYTVNIDTEIGLPMIRDENNRPVPQPVYRIDEFIFAGVNVGEHVDIRNPYNFSTSNSELPAPMDLDHDQVGPDNDSRKRYLTFLGIARQNDDALAWPTRFTGGKPYPNMVAIAEAHVFNNHSFDLWTQMWGTRLRPVGSLADWTTAMQQQTSELARVPALDNDEYQDLLTYLRSLEQLAQATLSH